MALSSPSERHRAGSWLVVLQFGLLLLLAIMALPRWMQGAGSLACAAWAVASLVWGGWTLLHNRLGNFNIRPTPKANGILVTTGPYRWVRHPMYTAVLLGAAALACLAEPIAAALTWAALALVLWVKASLEEQWMRETHPAYAAYCGQSKRFVPWIF